MSEAAMYQTREDGGRESTRSVRLRVPAIPASAPLARLALSGVAGLTAMSEEMLAELKLALSEAFAVAVGHAVARGALHVEIGYELRAGEILIEVVDDGVVFDPAAAGATAELRTEPIRALVDELEVDAKPELGELRLRFVKRLRAAA